MNPDLLAIESNFANLALVEEMYDKYKRDPYDIDSSWRAIFQSFEMDRSPPPLTKETARIPTASPVESKDLRVYHLIQAYRTYGHLSANINPISTSPLKEPPQLQLKSFGFTESELGQPFPTYGLLSTEKAPLKEIIEVLKSIYCDKIGVEYMCLERPELEEWLQQRIEPNRFRINLSIEQKQMILKQLNRSELFESFIQMKYTGQKRFSLEGGETLIPMLEAVVETGSGIGLEKCVIGMAHRGRLNVLSNILNKSHADIFSEFEEGYIPNSFEGSGDVKYHKGFSAEVTTPQGAKVQIILSPNPSHLESVDPVVEGQVRATQVAIGDDVRQEKVVPILIHGDAAIAGQGVVYETMQLYRLPGYSTGGTVHVVINNQVGFTATADESRSTQYCTDIARAFSAPVFHVNAEDPEACVYATNLAIQIRQKFHCDVFIDLNCYRKYGHNEADEPAYTQPLEYQLIRKKRPIRELYRDQLIHEGAVEKHLAEELEQQFVKGLHQALQESKIVTDNPKAAENNQKSTSDIFQSIKTEVAKGLLQEVAKGFCTVPDGFKLHPKLHHLLQERLSMVQDKDAKPIDWGMAELLAYGSLLWEGTPVRLSGQDCERGTFSHRHAIWMDQQVERAYSSLSHLKANQGRFDVVNSPLSEFAVLGFEYGYSFASPKALVIWEAQFGDFCNGAQVIIDQYIATAEQKWGQKVGLVLFLPHGYEGQGPEHSSGRMERFLSLAAQDNMRIVNPTTPAQFFHLIRRQIINPTRKPLIAFTPKGLLRHPVCVSRLDDLTQGSFQEILDDPEKRYQAKRLLLCSGRIYYDLIAEREKRKQVNVAVVRIEQLYPLHTERLTEVIRQYKGLQECMWVQEEPCNMGAWEFLHSQLPGLLPKEVNLRYVGRKRSASPAAGSYAIHKKQHAEIMDTALGGG